MSLFNSTLASLLAGVLLLDAVVPIAGAQVPGAHDIGCYKMYYVYNPQVAGGPPQAHYQTGGEALTATESAGIDAAIKMIEGWESAGCPPAPQEDSPSDGATLRDLHGKGKICKEAKAKEDAFDVVTGTGALPNGQYPSNGSLANGEIGVGVHGQPAINVQPHQIPKPMLGGGAFGGTPPIEFAVKDVANLAKKLIHEVDNLNHPPLPGETSQQNETRIFRDYTFPKICELVDCLKDKVTGDPPTSAFSQDVAELCKYLLQINEKFCKEYKDPQWNPIACASCAGVGVDITQFETPCPEEPTGDGSGQASLPSGKQSERLVYPGYTGNAYLYPDMLSLICIVEGDSAHPDGFFYIDFSVQYSGFYPVTIESFGSRGIVCAGYNFLTGSAQVISISLDLPSASGWTSQVVYEGLDLTWPVAIEQDGESPDFFVLDSVSGNVFALSLRGGALTLYASGAQNPLLAQGRYLEVLTVYLLPSNTTIFDPESGSTPVHVVAVRNQSRSEIGAVIPSAPTMLVHLVDSDFDGILDYVENLFGN